MRTKTTISSEQEFLQAHLTVIWRQSGAGFPTWQNARRHLTFVLQSFYVRVVHLPWFRRLSTMAAPGEAGLQRGTEGFGGHASGGAL